MLCVCVCACCDSQDALGGNSRTVMLACISQMEADLHETLNTLQVMLNLVMLPFLLVVMMSVVVNNSSSCACIAAVIVRIAGQRGAEQGGGQCCGGRGVDGCGAGRGLGE